MPLLPIPLPILIPMKAGILDSRPSSASSSIASQAIIPCPSSLISSSSLVRPSQRRHHRSRGARVFRSIFRALPICKLPATFKAGFHGQEGGSVLSGGARNLQCAKVTGTLFGYRKGRMSLSMQENSMCLPSLVVELALPTHVLTREMSAGMVRIALECEKKAEQRPRNLLEEPTWTVFFNGKKSGYGQRREATEDDLEVMELLRAVSMGAGVLPGKSDTEGPDAEMAYMRATFYHVVGSRDSETLYMFGPEGNSGPDLTIFFVRV